MAAETGEFSVLEVARMGNSKGTKRSSTGEPMEVHLIAKSKPKWLFDEEANAKTEALESLGYRRFGQFAVEEIPGVLMAAFIHDEEPLFALVSEHPFAGTWSEVVARYADGGSLTVTNSMFSGAIEPMPFHEKAALRKNEKALHQYAVKHMRRAAAIVPTEAEFVQVFEEAYRKEMAWREGKGVSEAEVRKVAALGNESFGEETISRTVKSLNKDYSLACAENGQCPYKAKDEFEIAMEHMPKLKTGDPRRCPENGRKCPEFAEIEDYPKEAIPDPSTIEVSASVLAYTAIKPIRLFDETGEMKTAISKAKATLNNGFLRHLRAHGTEMSRFMLRVRVETDGSADYVWVEQVKELKEGFAGRALFEPSRPTIVKEGKVLRFTREQITDWAFRAGDNTWVGCHTGAVLLKRMEKATVTLERALEKESKGNQRIIAQLLKKKAKE
jgi:uncharacterized protein YegJ (DUF2314 family)